MIIRPLFYTEGLDIPKELVKVAEVSTINKIFEIAKVLQPYQKDLFSFNVDAVLFDLPEDSDFRYDVAYVRCYVGINGEVSAYQYFQSKWDSSSQIESEEIDLIELKESLNKK